MPDRFVLDRTLGLHASLYGLYILTLGYGIGVGGVAVEASYCLAGCITCGLLLFGFVGDSDRACANGAPGLAAAATVLACVVQHVGSDAFGQAICAFSKHIGAHVEARRRY